MSSSSRVRVLILTPWYPDPTAPVESDLRLSGVFVREQARAAATLADAVVLHLHGDPRSACAASHVLEDPGLVDGVRTLRVRFRPRRLPGWNIAVQALGTARALRRLRREGWRPDVLHAHVFYAGALGLVLSRALRTPLVVTEHLSLFRTGELPRWMAFVSSRVFRSAELVAPVSEDLAAHLRRIAPDAHFRVVPNSVDVSSFRASPPPSHTAPMLLTVGRLVELKGLGYLIEALARARQRGATSQLRIVGTGPLRAELEAQARRLSLDDAVTFHGFAEKPEVAALMARADALVQPSTTENLPCSVIEAQACGLPVIGSHVGGMPELVHAGNGILVEPRDVDALADAILEFERDGDRFDRRQIAAETVARFSEEQVGTTWHAIYQQVRRHEARKP